ncbi:hypothetical protein ACFL3T_04560 [Patescibacteria group bacterium]
MKIRQLSSKEYAELLEEKVREALPADKIDEITQSANWVLFQMRLRLVEKMDVCMTIAEMQNDINDFTEALLTGSAFITVTNYISRHGKIR